MVRKSRNVVRADKGLVDEVEWRAYLKGYPVDLALEIRRRLKRNVEGLAEKFNRKSRYFGYRRCGGPDVVYIYIQKQRLRIDLRIQRKYEEELRRSGFTVHYSHGFQGRAGWLTGWRVPHETRNTEVVLKWIQKAFEADAMG